MNTHATLLLVHVDDVAVLHLQGVRRVGGVDWVPVQQKTDAAKVCALNTAGWPGGLGHSAGARE